MASELRVNTLKDANGNNSIATSVVFNGTAKAWIKFDMSSSFTNEDSFNVSSLDDDGTGDFGLNFSNNMANVNYPAPASAGEDNANVLTNFGTIATSSMDGQTRQTNTNAAIDKLNNSVCILGDLA